MLDISLARRMLGCSYLAQIWSMHILALVNCLTRGGASAVCRKGTLQNRARQVVQSIEKATTNKI